DRQRDATVTGVQTGALPIYRDALGNPGCPTRLDLVDRAFDQIADLKNLPQLAAILRRQVTKDLSLVGGIGNTHGRTHGFGANQEIGRASCREGVYAATLAKV